MLESDEPFYRNGCWLTMQGEGMAFYQLSAAVAILPAIGIKWQYSTTKGACV